MLPIPRPAKVMLAALALLVVIIFVVFLFSLPDYSMLYGIKEVAEVNGHPIFLKRESSNMFYDRTSLSLDGDRCTDPNPKFDYRLTPLGAGDYPTYFQVVGDQLTVYQSVDQPTAKPWPFVVIQKPIDVREFSTMHHGDPQGVFESQVTRQDLAECHFSLKYFPKRH